MRRILEQRASCPHLASASPRPNEVPRYPRSMGYRAAAVQWSTASPRSNRKLCAEKAVGECALSLSSNRDGTQRLQPCKRLYSGISVALYAPSARACSTDHRGGYGARRDGAIVFTLSDEKRIDQRHEYCAEQLEWPDLSAQSQQQTRLKYVQVRETQTL